MVVVVVVMLMYSMMAFHPSCRQRAVYTQLEAACGGDGGDADV